jgi:hypothetical protein
MMRLKQTLRLYGHVYNYLVDIAIDPHSYLTIVFTLLFPPATILFGTIDAWTRFRFDASLFAQLFTRLPLLPFCHTSVSMSQCGLYVLAWTCIDLLIWRINTQTKTITTRMEEQAAAGDSSQGGHPGVPTVAQGDWDG